MADVIVYRYDETKGRYGGVPARDLTQTDYDRLPLKLQAAVDQEGSPYTKVSKKKADADEATDLHKMTREELNSYAGWAGVTTDAEDFATKADIIAAIEAALKGGE